MPSHSGAERYYAAEEKRWAVWGAWVSWEYRQRMEQAMPLAARVRIRGPEAREQRRVVSSRRAPSAWEAYQGNQHTEAQHGR